ncbi:hypothetical protein BZA05DRAFT_194108 [Tricharina praecox]|uniref:uncharacterized protein n=1 Tax=Tricharina praecox TaxID=43433 RepID=UPI00221F24DC|nr:uncharacterized protein BZA05DRAFT_243107 [Tricharina praecox]XP_051335136.1 uncharacterized protein BZA05DRAFT_194108 [Tricharina praecox]KAI5840898.1 hypothetical protein BZA05DRAFT_243107 [Tricharina praecox]KAI5842364.1 hypothetical protein BZA05DRAFT_194108 [Tricharina praecox]
MQSAYDSDPAGSALTKKRRRVDSNTSNLSGTSATAQPCIPTLPLTTDQAELWRSSLRQANTYSSSVDELWPALWLHPDINAVVGRMTKKIEGGDYTYRRAWQLMQIGDLQIVYVLSGLPQALRDQGKAHSSLLIASVALRCALALSAPQVKHQIPPDCFMEREIQLRALGSMLSLLQLLKAQAPARNPVLTAATEKLLWENLRVLQEDLSKSLGGAADKGDCEFMARYAQNLLADLPGDDNVATKWASSIMNIFFAAGMAYQYNGPEAIKLLRLAVEPLSHRGTSWHREFDRFHHVTMVIISWSLYHNAGSSPAFRLACSDMIGLLRNKLRDGINNLNAQGSTKRKISALFPSTEATDSSVHMTYGLLYLLGRLVERYMAGGGSSREKQIAQLTDVLVWACQKSKFGEIKFKAYEILFAILAPVPSANTAGTLLQHQRMTEVEGDSRMERERRHEEWATHVECILERKRLIDNSLAKLDLEQIKRAKDDYEQQVARTPMTPPTKSHDMIREYSHDSMQSAGTGPGMATGGAGVLRQDYRLDFTLPAFQSPNLLPPLSPATSYAESDEYVWQQSPPPFPLERMTRTEPAEIKLKGIPVCTQISNTGHSVAFLSRDHLDVYGITLEENPTLSLSLTQKLEQKLPKKSDFVATAVNDQFVVAISRNQLQIYDHSTPSQPSGTIDFDYQPEPVLRLTSVALTSTTPPTIALGLILHDKRTRIHLYEAIPSPGHLPLHHLRTLSFGTSVPQPHGAAGSLSFSTCSTHLLCTSTLRGDLLTWPLHYASATPSHRTVIPINDGLGHGIAGITSAALFPSTRYIIATTGASSQPAVLAARSSAGAGARRPALLDIMQPQAAMRACAVARQENAIALMTERGAVWVAKLSGAGAQVGHAVALPVLVLERGGAGAGDVSFGISEGGRQVLLVARVDRPLFKSRWRGDVVGVVF